MAPDNKINSAVVFRATGTISQNFFTIVIFSKGFILQKP